MFVYHPSKVLAQLGKILGPSVQLRSMWPAPRKLIRVEG
jgi:hypothetical protein